MRTEGLSKEIERIANENAKLVSMVVSNMVMRNHTSIENLEQASVSQLKRELKVLLKSLKRANSDIKQLDYEINRESFNIDNFKRSFVSGENFDSIGAGHNNGLIRNTVEEKAIQVLEMEEEQMKRFAKRASLLKSLDEHNKLIKEFCYIEPNGLYGKVVYEIQVLDKTRTQVADKYCVSYSSLGIYEGRGLSNLASIMRCYLDSKQKS